MWQKKKEVKKGNFGENIIDNYLTSLGYSIYFPSEGAHPFDRLVAKSYNEMFVAEIKTKPQRMYYPDTGININSFETYGKIQKIYNLPVFIFFVDEIKEEIYGNYLYKLINPRMIKYKDKILYYPFRHKGIVYFPLANMAFISSLKKEYCKEIAQLRASAYR